jgi:hypothetical protein
LVLAKHIEREGMSGLYRELGNPERVRPSVVGGVKADSGTYKTVDAASSGRSRTGWG